MIALYRQGAGAVVTKNICLPVAKNPTRYMCVSQGDTLINCERYLDFPGQQWIDKEIPKAALAGVPVIANVGTNREQCKGVAEQLEDAGTFAVECVSYVADWLVDVVDETRRGTKLPILAKLSPNYPDIVDVARRCIEAGADGFTVGDSKGPVLRIDIQTGRPISGGCDGNAWLSGAGLKPFALRNVLDVRNFTHLPIIGMGGVCTWEDCIEMVMAGANMVGLCSSLVTRGSGVIGEMNRGIDTYLQAKNLQDLQQIQGVVRRHISSVDLQQDLPLSFQPQHCTQCGQCAQVCVYHAWELNSQGFPVFQPDLCSKCGMCLSLCQAIGETTNNSLELGDL